MTPDSIGLIVGAVLTVLVLTYIIGDSFLFRLAVYIFPSKTGTSSHG